MSSNKVPEGPSKELDDSDSMDVDEKTSTYKTVIRQWNLFAKQQGYPLWDNLSEEDVCGTVHENGSLADQNNPPLRKMMAEYASCLLLYTFTEGGKEKHYKTKVVAQKFTTLKSGLFERFKPLGYSGKLPDWYSDLLSALKVRSGTAALARGDILYEKTPGFYRDAIVGCCSYLMSQPVYSEALAYEERFILSTLFHAVGRGGEVSTLTWNTVDWNETLQSLCVPWGEFKKGQQSELGFFPDSESYKLDFFHAQACALLAGYGGGSKGINGEIWMFPSYVDMAEGGAASKVSRVLTKCHEGDVEGIPAGATSHGVRVTATDTMLINSLIGIFPVIARGGWDFCGDSTFFQYPTYKLHQMVAGKVLAGWHNPNMHVVAYTLLAIPAGNERELARNYASELFSSTSVAHLLQGKLKSYRDVMTAGLLMYYEQTKTDLGLDSLLIRVMHTCAKRVDVSFSTLGHWGTLIKDHFFASNAANYASAPDQDATQKVVAIMQDMVLKKNDKIDKLVSKVDEIEGHMKNVVGMLEQLCLTGASATPTRRTKAAKTSRDDTAASPVSKAPHTNQPPTEDAFTAMASAQARHVVTDFTGANDWSLTKLVLEVLKGKTNIDGVNWHSGDLKKGMASKVKKAYKMLEGLASDDEKKYFNCKLLPQIAGGPRSEWLLKVSKIVEHLEIQMVDNLVRRNCPGASELEIASAKSRQKTNVSALGGLIEKLNTVANKAAEK